MDRSLHTKSIWAETSRPPKFPEFQGKLEVDVAIVGAGITGLTAATLLKQAGKKVAVLERQEFGEHGTTHRTSAHLTEALDISYPTLIRRFGEDVARQAIAAST